MIRVWDWWVRIGHWLLVLSILVAWITRHGGGAWHEWPGYAALLIVILRSLWGFVGPEYARFSNFVRKPQAVLDYIRALRSKREPHYLGHNPLGGVMVVALLIAVAFVAVSGWLYTTDRFWGVEWVGELHGILADSLLILILLHVVGVAFTSSREGQNLIASMFHGKKRIR